MNSFQKFKIKNKKSKIYNVAEGRCEKRLGSPGGFCFRGQMRETAYLISWRIFFSKSVATARCCRGQMSETAYLIFWRIFLSKICRSCQMLQRADDRNSLPDLLEDFLIKNLSLLLDVAEGR
jgi:hypothetical protein